MHAHMQACVYARKALCACARVCMYLCVYLCVFACERTRKCSPGVSVRVCSIRDRERADICVCVCVCMYINVYTHAYSSMSACAYICRQACKRHIDEGTLMHATYSSTRAHMCIHLYSIVRHYVYIQKIYTYA
jgi:hypothetical protein